MKKLLPGLLTALVGAIVCREVYARGFNRGVGECKKVINMTMNVTDIISKKENEKEED